MKLYNPGDKSFETDFSLPSEKAVSLVFNVFLSSNHNFVPLHQNLVLHPTKIFRQGKQKLSVLEKLTIAKISPISQPLRKTLVNYLKHEFVMLHMRTRLIDFACAWVMK